MAFATLSQFPSRIDGRLGAGAGWDSERSPDVSVRAGIDAHRFGVSTSPHGDDSFDAESTSATRIDGTGAFAAVGSQRDCGGCAGETETP